MLSHFSHVQLFVTLWTVAHQAPLPMGFSRQEYWSGLPYPPPVDLFDPEIELTSLMSPALSGGCFTMSASWEASNHKGMRIVDHLRCLLRNLYASQESRVRTRLGTMDWFQIGKGVCQGCMLSPCLFNIYAEYITQNAGLDEAQAGIKIAGRNINNLRYADDTTLMAESEKELKSLLMKVKEESEKAGLKHNIQKMKIMASGLITSWKQ